MAFCDSPYLEKIGCIQQRMHEREKKRLQLEKELLAYYRTDERFSRIQCAKLHEYLQEVCEREKQAKMRNGKLLKNLECITAQLKKNCPDRSTLLQRKVEWWDSISKFKAAGNNKKRDIEAAKEIGLLEQSSSCSLEPLAEGLHQPATIFMGCESSKKVSTAQDAATSVSSVQPSNSSPNCFPPSSEGLQSGPLKNAASKEAVADSRANLSDDISDSKDSPDGTNLSAERRRASAACLRDFPATRGKATPESDEQFSPSLTLEEQENSSQCQASQSRVCVENVPAECTRLQGSNNRGRTKEDAVRAPQWFFPESASQEYKEAPERREYPSIPSSRVQSATVLSMTTGNDRSASLTVSDLEEVPEEGVQGETLTGKPGTTRAPVGRSVSTSRGHSSLGTAVATISGQSRSGSPSPNILSLEGFFHLLECIEGHLGREDPKLYCVSSLDKEKRNDLISLCNKKVRLNDEDLEACATVVLAELQRLSWSTSKRCLLPEEIVNANWSTVEPGSIKSRLASDGGALWDRWFKHALRLEDHHVLSADAIAQLFAPALVEENAPYCEKAEALLRKLLTRRDSSASAGVQSGEEDSEDESPVESSPIRGKKTQAYQLLKQSATRESYWSSEVQDECSDLELSGKTSDMYRDDMGMEESATFPEPSRGGEKVPIKPFSALQSKAFWGESDDSSSDIEAALRPRSPNVRNEDADDFYN